MTIRTTAIFLAVVTGLGTSVAQAQDYSGMGCAQLWYQRNAKLKARGFCFTDPRAVRIFGNAGCTVTMESKVPLSPSERQDIARIVLVERMKLCR